MDHVIGCVSSCQGDGRINPPIKELNPTPFTLKGFFIRIFSILDRAALSLPAPPPQLSEHYFVFFIRDVTFGHTECSVWILDLSTLFSPDPHSRLLHSLEISSVCVALAGFPVVRGCALPPAF